MSVYLYHKDFEEKWPMLFMSKLYSLMHFYGNKTVRLHKTFGNPSADKLYSVLGRSELPYISSKIRIILGDIIRKFLRYQQFAHAPRAFKYGFCKNKNFNHTLFGNAVYINREVRLFMLLMDLRTTKPCTVYPAYRLMLFGLLFACVELSSLCAFLMSLRTMQEESPWTRCCS